MRARPVLKVLAKAAIAVACVSLAALMLTLITLVQLLSSGFVLTILKVTFVFALASLLLHAFTGRALDAALVSVPAFLIAVSVAIASGALSPTVVPAADGAQQLPRAGTRQEVLDFLAADDTDAFPYVPGVFVCGDFAQRLQERAHERGLSCWMVFIYPKSGPYGHVVNAFPLAEGSIIYVEPQNDTVSENILTFFRWCTWDNTFEVILHDDFGREIVYYLENVRW
jgi:hypothetical protein